MVVKYISIEEAVEMLEYQLSYAGYTLRTDYTLRGFLRDKSNDVYFLSGVFGRGFQLHKRHDDKGIYLEYTQYPEYETSQSFAWVLNRNHEWKRYRLRG